jgi:hypothetical protein
MDPTLMWGGWQVGEGGGERQSRVMTPQVLKIVNSGSR